MAIISNFPTGDVQDKTYGVCSTAAGTAAKTVDLEGFKLEEGAIIAVKFSNASTAASPTLNVNGTGAKPIMKYGITAADTNMWQAGAVVVFAYDGTNWVMENGTTATTTYYGITKLSSATNSTATNLAATPSAVKAAYDLASGKSDSGHKHTKSDITDFPTSMPASDVSAWAKAANKPSYTASEVGALSSGATAVAATKLAAARSLKVNLASESAASFNGTAAASIGVDGILSVKHGGTGVNNLNDLKSMLEFGVPVSSLGVSSVLNDNSWADIKRVSDLGMAANCWSVGDQKTITLNGKVGDFTFSDLSIDAFIIGFDHNSAKEGGNRIHFQIGKINGKNVALCDSNYDTDSTSAGQFQMNTSNTNVGGWKESYMRQTLLGNSGDPTNPPENSLLAALPADLRAVMKSVQKYTDNTAGQTNVASNVTATADWLFLLAEYEVFGTRSYANSAEQNYQYQYDYYKAGNSKIAYNHSADSTIAWWWLRSPSTNTNLRFRDVTGTGVNNSYSASFSAGVRPGFSV